MAGLYVIIAGAGKVGWNLARELLERGADREAPAGLLPALAELDVEPLVRERVLVEHGHGVPRAQRGGGHGRSNPAGSDDEDEHWRGL